MYIVRSTVARLAKKIVVSVWKSSTGWIPESMGRRCVDGAQAPVTMQKRGEPDLFLRNVVSQTKELASLAVNVRKSETWISDKFHDHSNHVLIREAYYQFVSHSSRCFSNLFFKSSFNCSRQ